MKTSSYIKELAQTHFPKGVPAFKSNGYVSKTYSDTDNNKTFAIVADMELCNVVGNGVTLYTPYDKIPYQIVSEIETSYNKYTVTVMVGNKSKTFKCNICNMDKKTMEAVRSIA